MEREEYEYQMARRRHAGSVETRRRELVARIETIPDRSGQNRCPAPDLMGMNRLEFTEMIVLAETVGVPSKGNE